MRVLHSEVRKEKEKEKKEDTSVGEAVSVCLTSGEIFAECSPLIGPGLSRMCWIMLLLFQLSYAIKTQPKAHKFSYKPKPLLYGIRVSWIYNSHPFVIRGA